MLSAFIVNLVDGISSDGSFRSVVITSDIKILDITVDPISDCRL